AAGPAEPETRSVTGGRAVANLIMQVVARAERRAEGVLSAELLRPTLPAWRRAKERATLELRVAGEVPAEASPILSGTVSGDAPTVLLIDDVQAVLVAGSGETAAGMWSSHPAVVALARAWVRSLACGDFLSCCCAPSAAAGPAPYPRPSCSPPGPSSPPATWWWTERGSAISTRGGALQWSFCTASAPRCTPGARTSEPWRQRAFA